MPVHRTCVRCGASFTTNASEIRRRGGLYCSRACYGADHALNLAPVVCAACGRSFTPDREGRRFCSRACTAALHRPPPRPTLAVTRQCLYCGRDVVVRPSEERSGGGRYCSHSCSAKHHTGERSARWKTGRYVAPTGYVHITVEGVGTVLEHRYVAEQMIGRPLRRGEEVHHINGLKGDNRPENLEVLTTSQHKRRHRETS